MSAFTASIKVHLLPRQNAFHHKICSTLYFHQQRAFGGGVISIKLLHFENTQDRLPDGTCCDDWSIRKGKCNTCEYFFAFCISDLNNRACSFKQMTTDILSWDDYYAFEEELYLAPYGDTIKNPIKIPFTRWNGGMGFGVKAYDQDDRTSQLISDFKQNITINATRNGIRPSVNSVLLEGKVRPVGGTIPKLTAEISVSCDANYLIPTCSDLCIDTNDATGHYKCNYVKGKRECLQGWYGERCNKKVVLCTPRNDTLGHYKCNSATGEKICLPGWRNATTHCTEAILPSLSTSIKPSSSIKSQKITSSIMQITSESQITSITSISITLADTTSVVPTTTITLAPMTSAIPSLKHIPTITPKISSTTSTSKPVTAINPSLKAPEMITMTRSKTVISSITSTKAPETITMKRSKTVISSITSTTLAPTASITPNFEASAAVASKRSITLSVFHSSRLAGHASQIDNSRITIHTVAESRQPATSPQARKSMIPQETILPISTVHKVKASTIRIRKPKTVDHKSVFVPTTATSKESGKKKFFDLTKISAFIVAIGLLLILMFLVFILLVRKQRKRRVQPFTFSERYKQNSSRIISSRNSKCTDISMPSIRGMAETRFGSSNDVSMKEMEKRCINSSVSGRQMNSSPGRSDGVSQLSINQQNNENIKNSSGKLSNQTETASLNFLVIPGRHGSKQGITL
eukprot:Seg2333.3 transcript_id=Seg2333.3/GoldUCD/mRNA.D3Y31 product="Delta-like protein 4" protein_id=Seg2333.3/GoldUCD/D3Y31